MTAFEIVLVVTGLILFVGSFFVSEKIVATKEQLKVAIDGKEVKKLLQLQIDDMSDDITALVNESVQESLSEVKRAMEKLSNEKIMAINEYSDTVMESIHKSHNEVMFLYGMLNDKNKEITDTAELITKANKSMKKKMSEAEPLVERMDSQVVFMKQYLEGQAQAMDRIEKSTVMIEALEKQIGVIEQTALQFTANHKKVKQIDKREEIKKDETKDQIVLENSQMSQLIIQNELSQDTSVLEKTQSKVGKAESLSKEQGKQEVQMDSEATDYNDKILEMSKKGQSALEIAKTFGIGVGEVQLVIDLFKGGRR